jgi:large subunit ribosomal protein L9
MLTFDLSDMQSRTGHLLLLRLFARPVLAGNARSYGQRLESKPWRQKPNRKAKLSLILTEDVPKLGSRGHLVRVEHGHGRNRLLPQGKAVYATPDNIKLYNIQEPQKGLDNDTDVVTFIHNIFKKHQITISRSDRREWTIYEHHIANVLRRYRLHVPLDCIQLSSPLTSYGVHPVVLRVDELTEIPFTVRIEPISQQTDSTSDEVKAVHKI